MAICGDSPHYYTDRGSDRVARPIYSSPLLFVAEKERKKEKEKIREQVPFGFGIFIVYSPRVHVVTYGKATRKGEDNWKGKGKRS